MRRATRLLAFCAAGHRLAAYALYPTMDLMRSRVGRAAIVQPRGGVRVLGARMMSGTDDYDRPPPSWVVNAANDDDEIDDGTYYTPRSQAGPAPVVTFEAALEMPRGVCSGCGARFQCDDTGAPGFVPEKVMREREGAKTSEGEKAAICQRCHGLRHQNKLPVETLRVGRDDSHEELRPEYFVSLLKDISRRRCVVVAIVDLFDFHGSLVPDLPLVVGSDNDLILVGNKLDLLPERVALGGVERWVRSEARKAQLPKLHSVHLVSCKSGHGMKGLISQLTDMMRQRRLDAYVVGAANAGKSSFINHCLRSVDAGKSVTTSHLPGTTLDFVRVSVLAGQYSLFDTPGVVLDNQLTTRLTTSELGQVVPKKRAQHVTLRVAEGKSVLLGGIARLHMEEGRPFLFTFYLANDVSIHPTSTAKVEDVLEKHAGGMLSPPASYERLQELGEFGATKFEISGRGWDEAACDIVLPGLGWVAVTGSGRCAISVELPEPVRALRREPLIPSEEGKGIKGTKKSYVKFTGSKLKDGRGNRKRAR